MSVAGGYNGALQWMLAHGWTRADLDHFLEGNPGDWGRVDSAFGDDSPHSVAAQAGNTHASPGVIDVVSMTPVASSTPASSPYAVPTPVGAAPGLQPAASDSIISGSAILPAISGGLSVPAAAAAPASGLGGIPTWAYVAAAGVLLVVLLRR